jgi:hypothetical protein
MIRTFDIEELRKEIEIGKSKTFSGYCHPDEIKRLEPEGFEVVNYDFGYEEIQVTRIF